MLSQAKLGREKIHFPFKINRRTRLEMQRAAPPTPLVTASGNSGQVLVSDAIPEISQLNYVISDVALTDMDY